MLESYLDLADTKGKAKARGVAEAIRRAMHEADLAARASLLDDLFLDDNRGGLVTVFLFQFVAIWNNFMLPYIMLGDDHLYPVTVGLSGLLNQGASTLIAGIFLPVVAAHGYNTMFFAWGACTAVYLAVASFLLPETKGRTLEEIELLFAGRNHLVSER